MGVGLILRLGNLFVVAPAGVSAQIFVHWAITPMQTGKPSDPMDKEYRFDPLNGRSTLRKIKIYAQ